jgi:hypothetical protein
VHDFEVNPNIASVTKACVTGVQRMEWEFALPNKDNGIGQVSVCGLSVVGGVGNSMTLKFVNTANFAGESVNLVGHDAT